MNVKKRIRLGRAVLLTVLAFLAAATLAATSTTWVTVPPEKLSPPPAESGLDLPLGGDR